MPKPPNLPDRRLLSLLGSVRGRIATALSGKRLGMPSLSGRRLLWSSIALLIVTVLVAGFAWNTARGVTGVQRDVAEVLDTVRGQDLQQLTGPKEYAELLQQIREIERELGSLQTRATVLRGFRWVPGIGSRIREATLFLDMTNHFVRGTRLTL